MSILQVFMCCNTDLCFINKSDRWCKIKKKRIALFTLESKENNNFKLLVDHRTGFC